MFKALVIRKDDAGYRAAVEDVDNSALPAGEVTVRVAWSTITYKDGLPISARSPAGPQVPAARRRRPRRHG